MNIAIIGTGNVGSALAKGWARAGHEIFLGVRDLENFKGKDLPAFSEKIQVRSIEDSVQAAEVILLAVTPAAIVELVPQLGDLSEKIVIDAVNSVRVKPEGFENSTDALMSLTNCANIVKCFNTTGVENMFNPQYGAIGIDAFMSGDSPRAKEVARSLALDLGFEECYDFGGSDKFNLQEQFALSWINLAMMQGLGRNIAFKVLKRV